MNNKQLLLNLFETKCDFSNYMATGNEIILANLQNYTDQFTHIYGNSLSGKTHLLKAWANLANHHQNALYIDCHFAHESFINIDPEQYRFIAIDNIESLNDEQQINLFNLFNKIKIEGLDSYLLTSSSINLNHLGIRDDLKTRLMNGITFQVKSLNEDDLLIALKIYIKRQGIKFGETELKYMLEHYERNLGKLINIITQVTNKALTEKKSITIPLIKSCNL